MRALGPLEIGIKQVFKLKLKARVNNKLNSSRELLQAMNYCTFFNMFPFGSLSYLWKDSLWCIRPSPSLVRFIPGHDWSSFKVTEQRRWLPPRGASLPLSRTSWDS